MLILRSDQIALFEATQQERFAQALAARLGAELGWTLSAVEEALELGFEGAEEAERWVTLRQVHGEALTARLEVAELLAHPELGPEAKLDEIELALGG